MSRVESETERMTQLVGDMLLLARLDTGRPLEREQADLSRLAVDAVSDAHIAGPDHQWLLDLPDEPVIVVGDEARLQQVLVNLLANARTHTPPGTSVTTSLDVHESGDDDSGGAVLTVTDDGPGIPAWLQPEIFERFARGDSSRSRRGGSTGLGLAIVAAVVRAHNGTIDVHSVPGKTQFVVKLPADSQASHSTAKSDA
jgi:two-component system OmpR family sensor kinase